MKANLQFDVVVVGGGPAGSVCALELAKDGARVGLLYRKDARRKGVELISARARSLLDLQVFTGLALRGNHIEVTETVSLWSDYEPQIFSSILNPYGKAIVVERFAFDETLRDQATAAGAKMLPGHDVTRLVRVHDHWHVFVRNRDELSVLNARWLVAATGRDACDLLGRRPSFRTREIALCAIMDSAPTAPRYAFHLELGKQGWWYALPHPRGGTFVCYCVTAATCAGVPVLSTFQVALERTRLIRDLVHVDAGMLVVKGCEFAIESGLHAAEALMAESNPNAITEYQKHVIEFSEHHRQQAYNYRAHAWGSG